MPSTPMHRCGVCALQEKSTEAGTADADAAAVITLFDFITETAKAGPLIVFLKVRY